MNGDLIYRLTEIYPENDYAIFTAFNEINLRKYTLVCEEDSWGATYKDAAPLVSPTFTGNPKAPTATTGTNTTQIATTAFVQQEINSAASSTVPLVDAGSGSAGTASTFSRNDHQHPYPDIIHIGSDAPTNTDIEFWLDTDEPGDTPVLSVNGQTGAVNLDADDVSAVAYFKIVPGNTDLNDVITSGFYRLTTNYTNAPSGADYSQMIVSRGSDTVAQIIFCYADSRVFVRTGYGIGGSSPTWVSWKEMSNVQGTAQIYNPVSNLNDFYTGVGIFSAETVNNPSEAWWLVISAGILGTATQTAYTLFNDAPPKTRYCASGNWSSWNDINSSASLPKVVVDNTTTTASVAAINKTYNVSGTGVIVAYASIMSDSTSDYGTWRAQIGHNGTVIMGSSTRFGTATADAYGASTSAPIQVNDGDTITISLYNSKTGTKYIYRRLLCFGSCTVS